MNPKKRKQDLWQTQAKKKYSNAVHGSTISSDIEAVYKCVSTDWMKTEYDDRVTEWIPLKKIKKLVKIVDHEGVDDNG